MKKNNIIVIVRIALLISIITSIQMFRMPKMITAVVVNAVLISSVYITGVKNSVIIGLLSPLMAIITGVIIPPLYPLVPIICVSNIVFVMIYFFNKNNNFVLKYIIPSIFKSLIILVSAQIMYRFLNIPIPAKIFLPGYFAVQFSSAIIGIIITQLIVKRISFK